jgi:hypothetical protein
MKTVNSNRHKPGKAGRRRLLVWTAKGLALLLLFALLFQAAQPALAVPNADPEAGEGTTGAEATWALYQIDASHNFYNLTDRSLKFDTNGYPHVAYGGKNLYYAWYNGTTWNKVIVDSSDGVGEYAALALDSNNLPRISYYDSANRSLKFAYYNGVSWQILTLESPSITTTDLSPANLERLNPGLDDYQIMAYPQGVVGIHTSIAVDSTNRVHITYMDTQNVDPANANGRLKYATWDGVNWQIGTIIDDRNPTGLYNSLAINRYTLRPCVSYLSEKYDDLRYACLSSGGAWEAETVDAAGDIGAFTSLVFDSKGIAYISYYDFANQNLKEANGSPGDWEINTLDTKGNTGMYTSVAIDANGKVFISHVNNSDGNVKLTTVAGSSSVLAQVPPEGRYTSVAIDKNNYPGVVYYRVDQAQLLYSHWNGSSWNAVVLDTAGDLGVSSSVDISFNDYPVIGYQNRTSEDLKVAYFFIDAWQKNNVLAANYRVGEYISLKLDSSQLTNIAYYDAGSGDAKFTRWNGSAWELRTIDDDSNDVGRYISLAIDSQNKWHVSYYDASDGNLKYAYWDGSTWKRAVVDSADDVGKYSSIAVDYNNRPYIAYYDATNKRLKLAYLSTTNVWVNQVVDPNTGVGEYAALAVDIYNQLYISYYDNPNGDLKLAFSSYAGGSWNYATLDSTGNVGLYTSLAVDGSGKAHISYYDASAGDLKYAYGGLGGATTQTIAWDGVVGLYTSIGLNNSGQPAISYYDYTNGELWLAMTYPLKVLSNKQYLPHVARNR